VNPSGDILVAVKRDLPSAVALNRGAELARRQRCRLRVLHVVDAGAPPDDGFVGTTSRDWTEALIAWAIRRGGVRVSAEDVVIRNGRAVGEIWREANTTAPSLLVLGGAVGGRPPGWLVRFLAQHARRLVLVAAERHRPAVVVGTDFRDADLPVLRSAAALTAGGISRVEVVHNVSLEREWAEAATSLNHPASRGSWSVDELHVTRERTPSAAILRRARAYDVDVVAVGAHETSGRTLREVLLAAKRSVLAVPLGAARRRVVTD
jgi:nucleotide-binding universal stress UspA family protein